MCWVAILNAITLQASEEINNFFRVVSILTNDVRCLLHKSQVFILTRYETKIRLELDSGNISPAFRIFIHIFSQL